MNSFTITSKTSACYHCGNAYTPRPGPAINRPLSGFCSFDCECTSIFKPVVVPDHINKPPINKTNKKAKKRQNKKSKKSILENNKIYMTMTPEEKKALRDYEKKLRIVNRTAKYKKKIDEYKAKHRVSEKTAINAVMALEARGY